VGEELPESWSSTLRRCLCAPLVISLLAVLSCKRLGGPSAEDGLSPQVVTTVGRTIESFEIAQQRANEHQRQGGANGAPPTKRLNLARTKLEAAARGRFAQILWSARFPHGQKARPRTRVGPGVIWCDVELTGDPDSNGGTDWVEYTTKISHLPAGTYRIVAPLDERTLRVPEKFTP
jgi:hypothetical protein